MTRLEDWGWDDRWKAVFAEGPGRGLKPARVTAERRGVYDVVDAEGEREARLTGTMRHKTAERADLPAVGDWIAVEPVAGERSVLVRHVLPRRTKLSRKAAGEAFEEQVIASNLDTVFIMTAFNQDFNARRLERFLTVCRDSGAETVLLINKIDACPDPEPYLREASGILGGASAVSLSAKSGAGVAELARWLRPGRTIGFVGSSGVGKSTLANRLIGSEKIRTSATRASDEQGRHTTTRRELFLLPGGGILLDTPGMREMQFWDVDRGLSQTFEEIDALSPSCRFKDCAHDREPGCAVKAGVESGAVTIERLTAWRKLAAELAERRTREMKRNWQNPPPQAGR